MQIIKDTTKFQLDGDSAIVIGKFDGMHLGHQKLLNEIVDKNNIGLQAVVFTFDPPPEVLFGKREQQELMTREEKRLCFERMGVDVVIEYPLNQVTAAIDPEEFIEKILIKQMRMKFIAAGNDLSFGKMGKGNTEMLQKHAVDHRYEISIIDKVRVEDVEISSTYVRNEILLGNMEKATALLGTPYGIMGEVTHGKKLGRTFGMPTANIMAGPTKLLPPNGVYFSRVTIHGQTYRGITNIGLNPTVENITEKKIETYLYDFNQEVYGEIIEVELLAFKRPEKKFASLEELKQQIAQDMEDGKIYTK